jgi:D-xylose transport system permease protein
MTTTTQTPELGQEPDGPDDDGQSAVETLRTSIRDYLDRIRGGDVASLLAVLGLVALVSVFSILRPDTFTSAFNFANLINQSAAVIVIAMGLVFVLLLGEIDLSAGVTAGVCGAMLGVVMTNHGWPWLPSVVVGLLTGAVIGSVIGWLVAYLGIPSFVVTLAGFLGFQGLLLVIIGEGGTIAYRNDTILSIMNKNVPVGLGWAMYVVGIAAFAGLTYWRNAKLRAAGLKADPVVVWLVKAAFITVVMGLVVYYLSIERSVNPGIISLKGMPRVVVLIVALLIGLTFLLTRTAWGRHVYAVGGNSEAARRAGIKVALVRLSCFAMCSTLAGVAGILLGSRDNSISTQTGGSTTLLYAVGAAVIGGTSLFGGKGRVVDAIIGGLVVAVINNGMLLLDKPSGQVYIVTGLVLLAAASVDALSRRRAAATGRG